MLADGNPLDDTARFFHGAPRALAKWLGVKDQGRAVGVTPHAHDSVAVFANGLDHDHTSRIFRASCHRMAQSLG